MACIDIVSTELREHHLAVHDVFGAAKRDDVDFIFFESLGFHANAVKITCENQVLTVGKDVLLGNIGGLEQDKAVFFFKIKRTKPVTVTIERQ